jgi:glycogen phosphorylase
MKALRSFSVRPHLPPTLAPLERLALNLRWSWDDRTRDLFRWVDPVAWDDVHHDPMRLLGEVDRERLETLGDEQAFLRYLSEIDGELTRYLNQDRWFQGRAAASPLRQVAYFSPEFGIS